MELKNVLNQLNAAGASHTKTASAGTPPASKTAAAQKELVAALGSALGTAGNATAEKTAGDHSASTALTKIANDLAAADKEAIVKEANVYGAALMDGFVARGMQYGLSLDGTEKTAAAEEPTQADFEKWAQANPEEFARQFQAGHNAVTEQIKTAQAAEWEKWASTPEGQREIAAYNMKQAQDTAVLEKLASTPEGQEKLASVQQGYVDTMQQLEKIASGAGGQEKLAAVQQGFVDGSAAIEKLAADYYTRGYNDTVTLLNVR